MELRKAYDSPCRRFGVKKCFIHCINISKIIHVCAIQMNHWYFFQRETVRSNQIYGEDSLFLLFFMKLYFGCFDDTATMKIRNRFTSYFADIRTFRNWHIWHNYLNVLTRESSNLEYSILILRASINNTLPYKRESGHTKETRKNTLKIVRISKTATFMKMNHNFARSKTKWINLIPLPVSLKIYYIFVRHCSVNGWSTFVQISKIFISLQR